MTALRCRECGCEQIDGEVNAATVDSSLKCRRCMRPISLKEWNEHRKAQEAEHEPA